MTPDAWQLLAKADRALQAGRILLESGYPEFAAGRAYYAMFYATQALLASKGLAFHKHGATHSAFGEHFVKPGLLDARYHRLLLNGYDKRIRGEYGTETLLEQQEVEQMLAEAQEFCEVAQRFLRQA